MKKQLLKAAIIGSTLGLAVALMPGCSKQSSQSDNANSSAQLAADEVANMSADEGTVMSNANAGVGKIIASVDSSIDSISWSVNPYHFVSGIGWVRYAVLTTSFGYMRTRADTITFYDTSGNILEIPTMATLYTLRHDRQVNQTKGIITAALSISVFDTLKKSADTTFVKNGAITGTCDGQTLKTGIISNVTRLYSNGYWQFPSSGSIAVDMPRYDFTITFTGTNASGNYTATVNVDNLVTGKSRTVYVTVSIY
ncbi:MAG: hypothetical protein ABSE00_01130 [Chitinispirillaceae bacterium]